MTVIYIHLTCARYGLCGNAPVDTIFWISMHEFYRGVHAVPAAVELSLFYTRRALRSAWLAPTADTASCRLGLGFAMKRLLVLAMTVSPHSTGLGPGGAPLFVERWHAEPATRASVGTSASEAARGRPSLSEGRQS